MSIPKLNTHSIPPKTDKNQDVVWVERNPVIEALIKIESVSQIRAHLNHGKIQDPKLKEIIEDGFAKMGLRDPNLKKEFFQDPANIMAFAEGFNRLDKEVGEYLDKHRELHAKIAELNFAEFGGVPATNIGDQRRNEPAPKR